MEKFSVTKLEIKKVCHLKDTTINLSDIDCRNLLYVRWSEMPDRHWNFPE